MKIFGILIGLLIVLCLFCGCVVININKGSGKSPQVSPSLAQTTPEPSPITISPLFWNTEVFGDGPAVTKTTRQLEIFLPSASMDSGAGFFSGGIVSTFKLHGDFDVQTDFNLGEWPASSGVRSGMCARFNSSDGHSYAIERASYGYNDGLSGTDVYLTDFSTPTGIIPSNDMSGKLRIVRQGSQWSTYYFNNGKWNLDYQMLNGDTRDVFIFLGAWGVNSQFIHKNVRLTFGNVIVNKGQIIRPDK